MYLSPICYNKIGVSRPGTLRTKSKNITRIFLLLKNNYMEGRWSVTIIQRSLSQSPRGRGSPLTKTTYIQLAHTPSPTHIHKLPFVFSQSVARKRPYSVWYILHTSQFLLHNVYISWCETCLSATQETAG